jgi:uncharacterized spore protein YtfJ
MEAKMTLEEQPERKDHIDELFTRLDELQKSASVNAVFGQPVQMGEKTIIPIASVRYGFGLGFGDQEDPSSEANSGGGGAAGAIAKPLGLAEITPESTRVETVVDEQRVIQAGILLGAWSVFWIGNALIRILGRSRRNASCAPCE